MCFVFVYSEKIGFIRLVTENKLVEMKKLKFILIGILGPWIIKILVSTIRIDHNPKEFYKNIKAIQGIYSFWHCTMLIPAYIGVNTDIQVLVSKHSDGEYIAQVAKRLGLGIIRGSTTRGGAKAVRELVDKARTGYSLAITPDGPRGPRFHFQMGCIFLSKRTGLPIIPVAVGLSRYWELPSWDKFRIPKPFSRALVMYGDPIHIPPKLDTNGMEYYRSVLEKTMKEMTDKADMLLQGKQNKLFFA